MLRYTLCTPPHRDLKIRVSAVPPGRRGFVADSAHFCVVSAVRLGGEVGGGSCGRADARQSEFVLSRLGKSGRRDSNPRPPGTPCERLEGRVKTPSSNHAVFWASVL